MQKRCQEESKERFSSSGDYSTFHQKAGEESKYCQKKSSRCQISDYWSETQPQCVYISNSGRRPRTRPQGPDAREFSEAKCPRGEFLSVTHKQGSSCELGVFHPRILVIIVFDGGEILIVFYKKNKADKCVCVWVCVCVRGGQVPCCPLCLAGADSGAREVQVHTYSRDAFFVLFCLQVSF